MDYHTGQVHRCSNLRMSMSVWSFDTPFWWVFFLASRTKPLNITLTCLTLVSFILRKAKFSLHACVMYFLVSSILLKSTISQIPFNPNCYLKSSCSIFVVVLIYWNPIVTSSSVPFFCYVIPFKPNHYFKCSCTCCVNPFKTQLLFQVFLFHSWLFCCLFI